MIVKYRKQHLLWWVFLAILLPGLIILSIIYRPDFPVNSKGVETEKINSNQ